MKRRMFGMGVLALAASSFVGCATKESVDVVRGIPPVGRSLQGIRPTIDEMRKLPAAQRAEVLQRVYPHLANDLTYHMRTLGEIRQDQTVSRVEFIWVDQLDNVVANSAGGIQRTGQLRYQLVALMHIAGVSEPRKVAVECLNGIAVPLDRLVKAGQSLGSHTPLERFVIRRRESLVTYLDYATAIDVAQRFGIPLYRGQKMTEHNLITPDEARKLEGTTNRLQVTAQVYEGDVFDLRNMRYTSRKLGIVRNG